MKVWQILEAIESPLYTLGFQVVQQGIKEWLPSIMKLLDQYTYKAQYRYQLAQLPSDDWSSEGFSRKDKLRDDQYQREYDVLVHEDNPALHEKIVTSFKEMLEAQLRAATMSYLESQFGKVERMVPKEPYDELRKRHLYFLQFVSVHIDINAVSKAGRPKTSGGYFTNFPNKSEFGDKWSQENVDWGNELGYGIKLYASENLIWLGALTPIMESLHIEHFGEYADRDSGLNNLLKKILPTWVHETVHAHQWAKRGVLGRQSFKYDWGLTYTPQIKKRQQIDKYNRKTELTQRYKRGGLRGFPSHLSNEENSDMGEWIEYFGTAHEIEAHAAGAAASIVHDIIKNQNDYSSDNTKQEYLNQNIDYVIQDIANGSIPYDSGSLNSYYDHIRNEAMRYLRLKTSSRDRDMNRDPRALYKVDVGARKVWTIFLTKMVKHLQSYKKAVPTWSERDPRLRTPEPPKPELPG
jgi:hypothetical protein